MLRWILCELLFTSRRKGKKTKTKIKHENRDIVHIGRHRRFLTLLFCSVLFCSHPLFFQTTRTKDLKPFCNKIQLSSKDSKLLHFFFCLLGRKIRSKWQAIDDSKVYDQFYEADDNKQVSKTNTPALLLYAHGSLCLLHTRPLILCTTLLLLLLFLFLLACLCNQNLCEINFQDGNQISVKYCIGSLGKQ